MERGIGGEVSQEWRKSGEVSLASLADKMLNLNANLQKKTNKFLSRIRDNLGITKITSALETFYDLDFNAFCKELVKAKIKLSLKQQDEWEEYFDEYKTEINAIKDEIDYTDKEINRKVYELYGLNEEEIKTVENS